MNTMTILDETRLQKLVPSIFATEQAKDLSSRYGFIPTIEVVRGLRNAGFHPVFAKQTRSRSEDGQAHAKHIMRFRHESNNHVGNTTGLLPEIVMVNSHDGASSYQLRAGVYRLVCANGMIVGDEMFCRRIRHSGDVIPKVVEAASALIEVIPISIDKAKEWNGLQLTHGQRQIFAEAAAGLKWEEDKMPVKASDLLAPKRRIDAATDLWTTLNVVQENVIRGGIRYRTEDGARQRTREVQSVGENVRLNTALWTLTERMAQLVRSTNDYHIQRSESLRAFVAMGNS